MFAVTARTRIRTTKITVTTTIRNILLLFFLFFGFLFVTCTHYFLLQQSPPLLPFVTILVVTSHHPYETTVRTTFRRTSNKNALSRSFKPPPPLCCFTTTTIKQTNHFENHNHQQYFGQNNNNNNIRLAISASSIVTGQNLQQQRYPTLFGWKEDSITKISYTSSNRYSTIQYATTTKQQQQYSDNNEMEDEKEQEQQEQEQLRRKKMIERHKYWILLVDDEESIRTAVGDYLYDIGYQVTACSDSDAVLEILTSKNQTLTTPPNLLVVNADNLDNLDNNNSGTTLSPNVDSRSNNSPPGLVIQPPKTGRSSSSSTTTRTSRRRYPDVIILDVRMPDSRMNGIELLQWIRTTNDSLHPKIQRIPVVMLTAKGLTNDRILGYQAGANVYLSKPFLPTELVSILDNLIVRQEQIHTATSIIKTTTSTSTSVPLPPQTTISLSTTNGINEVSSPLLSSAIGGTDHTNLDQAALTLLDMQEDLALIKRLLQQSTDQYISKRTDIYLTLAEQDVLKYVSDGYTNHEIAELRSTIVAGVTRIMKNLYMKTNTATRTELVKWGIQTGYIPKKKKKE